MAFTPDSVVHLCNAPIDNTYKDQIYFSSKSAQTEYFKSRIVHTYDNITYQRKDNCIRINAEIDSLWDCNYVMYQNKNFTNKWFYAFITKMEYVNQNVTSIYIETDVYQTWLFEATLKESFVVREHVMNDAIGANLVDEGLEHGEYKMRTYQQTNLFSQLSYVIGVSENLSSDGLEAGGVYGNVYSGISYHIFPKSQASAMTEYLNSYVNAGKGDAIQFIFVIPSCFIAKEQGTLDSETNAQSITYQLDPMKTDLDGYIPKNNKLYVYPYNLLYVSNNNGGSAEMRYEDFSNNPTFKFFSNISPSPSILCAPMNYRGVTGVNQEYGLSMQGFPLCSWNNDTYAAWLAQNNNAIGLRLATAGAKILVGAKTGNINAVSSGVTSVTNQMVEIEQHKIQPDQARGNTNGGSINLAIGTQDFFFSQYTIKYEYAKRIDEFFSMYGYQVNTVKVPNVSGRPRWNYVKTIDINIVGSIPNDDMTRLKQMYDDGVTLWKSGSYVGDYSGNNK